jgi:hypothetical protein
MTPEIITAVASIVAACGVVFAASQARVAAKQLTLFREQLRADHERSRREHAIDVLRRWTEALDKAQPSARKFIQGLNEDQCKLLIQREPFTVSHKHEELLKHALHDVLDVPDELNPVNGEITLNQRHISELLSLIIDHLNTLEVALLSWMNGVADKDIMESQFEYLVRFEDGNFVLENLRKVMAGKASFPAIDHFVSYLTEKYENAKPKAKPQIA